MGLSEPVRQDEPPSTRPEQLSQAEQLPQPVELPTDRASALPLQAQLTRFVIAGGLSALVDFGVLTALMSAGLGHTAAKAISFVAGTTTAYLINRRWTFRAGPSRRRFAAIVALYAATFAVQVGLFSVLFTALGRAGLGSWLVPLVAFVIAQGVATTVNFVVQRTLIFRVQRTLISRGPGPLISGRRASSVRDPG